MIQKIKENMSTIIFLGIGFILFTIAIILCVGAIQAFVLYADKPITEIPMWAYWFLAPRSVR